MTCSRASTEQLYFFLQLSQCFAKTRQNWHTMHKMFAIVDLAIFVNLHKHCVCVCVLSSKFHICIFIAKSFCSTQEPPSIPNLSLTSLGPDELCCCTDWQEILFSSPPSVLPPPPSAMKDHPGRSKGAHSIHIQTRSLNVGIISQVASFNMSFRPMALPTRQDKTAILGEISPIFRLWYPIRHF